VKLTEELGRFQRHCDIQVDASGGTQHLHAGTNAIVCCLELVHENGEVAAQMRRSNALLDRGILLVQERESTRYIARWSSLYLAREIAARAGVPAPPPEARTAGTAARTG